MSALSLRSLRRIASTLLACSTPLVARADVVQCGSSIAPGTICLDGDVFDDPNAGGPLEQGRVYLVASAIRVPDGKTLSVNGAIVKFAHASFLTVRGRIDVSPGSIFTSLHDDTAGGDTNLNGSNTLPAAGDWGGLTFTDGADASVVDGASVRFGATGIQLLLADVSILGTTVGDCAGDGLTLSSNSFPSVSGCSFLRCRKPVVGVPIGALPGFAGNSTSECREGTAISVREGTVPSGQNLVIGRPSSLNQDGVFELATGAGTIIDASSTLTLEPGVIIKLSTETAQSILVDGMLVAEHVTFTSIHDDSIGGDTNVNGSATLPEPGDWNGFVFDTTADASRLVNVGIRYAGYAIVPGPALRLSGADILLDGVTVTNCKGDALDLTGSSRPTIVDCEFRDNGFWPAVGVPVEAVPGFASNVAAGNGTSDALRLNVTGDTVSGIVLLDPGNTLNGDGVIVLETNLVVEPGATLTVNPGIVFKVPFAYDVTVAGALSTKGTAGAPVVFTSLRDDSFGGDTMKDGGTNQPAPGDWDGLIFGAGSSASVLQGFLVRYAGATNAVSAAIAMSGGTRPMLFDGRIEQCAKAALDLNSSAFPIVARCDFFDNDEAVKDVPIGAVAGFTDCDAQGNAKGDYMAVSTGEVVAGGSLGCVTLSPANSLGGTGVLVFTTGIHVFEGACLVVDGGCTLKFDTSAGVQIDGLLTAGSSGATTAFTRIEDDDFGGDTEQDGSGQASPGSWIGIRFGPASDGSTMDDVVVRYAGRLGDSLLLSSTSVSMADVVVRDGAGDAMDLVSTSRPTVTNCSFLDCDFAVNGVPIDAVPGFVDNDAGGNTTGDYLRVTSGTVGADLLVETRNGLSGGPIVLATNVVVPAGRELAIGGGVILKWSGLFGMTIDGTLRTLGSQFVPVQFTSIHDDVAGGDTNKNGNATIAEPGDWRDLSFSSNSDASVLAGLVVRHAGAFQASAVDLSGSDLKMLHARIERVQADALDLSSNSFPQIRNSSFVDGGGVAVDNVPLDAIRGFLENSATGNAVYDAIRVTSSTLQGDAEISFLNALNENGVFVIDTALDIAAARRLVVRQGVALKLVGPRAVTVNGSLDLDGTGFAPVVLTSIRDDGVVGDTNKDGGATVPAPGDWLGIVYQSSAAPSRAAHATLRFGGAATGAALRTANSTIVDLFGVRVEDAAGDGLRLFSLASDAADLVALRCGADGIDLPGGAFDVLFATVTDCVGVGLRGSSAHLGHVSSSISFANGGGEIDGFAPGEVHFSNVGPAFAGTDGNIDADPLFADASAGDLRLGASSPCLDAGELQKALLVQKDRDERSRALDHDLSGSLAADMGAYERSVYELVVNGKPEPGAVLTFEVTGPPGTTTLEIGRGDGFEVLDPLGYLMVGAERATVCVAPVGQRCQLVVPRFSRGPGLAVQATVRSAANEARGNVTQLFRFRVEKPVAVTPGPRQ